ncbi:MAG: hypothetical protein WCL30_03745, partial [Pseudomonadota bacterium]
YDQSILCQECDGKIGIFDQYAKEFLINKVPNHKLETKPCYEIPQKDINYSKLKKFFISLIWRASISNGGSVNIVSLGDYYSELALSYLKGDCELQDNMFAILIFKDSPNLKHHEAITFVKIRLARKIAYAIHFSGYQITIIPNAVDMIWDKGNNSPIELFFKRDNDLIILESDVDISGKDIMINALQNKLQKQKN